MQVRRMENLILKTLKFDLTVPTALSFLERCRQNIDMPHEEPEKYFNLIKVRIYDVLRLSQHRDGMRAKVLWFMRSLKKLMLSDKYQQKFPITQPATSKTSLIIRRREIIHFYLDYGHWKKSTQVHIVQNKFLDG